MSTLRLPTLPSISAADEQPTQTRTATSRYRNDPYRVSVLPKPVLVEAAQTRHPPRNLPAIAQPAPYSLPVSIQPQPRPERQDSSIALVKFKRTMASALYNKSEYPDLAVGNMVIVDGDRGEHFATVSRVAVKKCKSTPTHITRLATPEDIMQLGLIREQDDAAAAICREYVAQLGLQNTMRIVDAEFQLDGQKLTVFFLPVVEGAFVDFRSLQRALYQHFHCRIWIVDG